MCMSLSVHQKERSYNVAVRIYHYLFIKRKEVIKLRYVCILPRVGQMERSYKVAVCIYRHVLIKGKKL